MGSGDATTGGPITTGFNHVAIGTPDLDRLVGFYGTAFGAVVTFEMPAAPDHPRMAVIDLGAGGFLNAFEVPDESIIGSRTTQGGRGAIDHYALAVKSRALLDEIRERIVAAGGEVGDVQRLGPEWSLFFRDPDGMELEVCCLAD